VHIDIDQVIVGGIKGTSEARVLDWQWRDHVDHIFGEVRGRSRFLTVADIEKWEDVDAEDKAHLSQGWEKAIVDGAKLMESYVESESAGWVAQQIWGFEEVKVGEGEERRYTRHIVVRKGGEVRRLRLVYDWGGKL
jgi:hypothetical protein